MVSFTKNSVASDKWKVANKNLSLITYHLQLNKWVDLELITTLVVVAKIEIRGKK